MENEPRPYSFDEDDKLIPGWAQSGDNQIIYLGLLVALILGLSWGCSNIVGNNDTLDGVAGEFGIGTIDLSGVADDYDIRADLSGDSTALLRGTVATQAIKNRAGRDALAVEGITKVDNRLKVEGSTPTTTAALEVGDLQGAMDRFSVTGTVDGEAAILTGFVGTAQESAAAEVAASRVAGITTVTNRLVILEPQVEAALEAAGARDIDATTVVGTTATAVGYVDDEAQRAAALAAAAGVDGVSGSVGDELIVLDADVLSSLDGIGATGLSVTVVDGVATVSGEVADDAAKLAALEAAMVPGIIRVVDDLTIAAEAEPEPEPEPEGADTRDELNALFEANPIQFNTGSAVIKQESFAILDEALALLANTDAALEVQGYTDITGNAAANQTLSEERAQAVLDYLVANGASGSQLTAQGYGPTEEFGAGDSPEALAANRRVRFELI